METREKLREIKFKIKRRIPENSKYYAQTGTGLILILSSLGTSLVPPRSFLIGFVHLLAGLYIMPDIRYRLLFKLNLREPKRSVSLVLFFSILLTGLLVNTAQFGSNVENSPADMDRAYYDPVSPSINVEQREDSKIITASVQVQNIGDTGGNYTVAISENGVTEKKTTKRILPGSSAQFNHSLSLEESGEYQIGFFSSIARSSSDENFNLQERINIPYYVNKENIRNAVQSYSEIPQKDLDNVLKIKISETERGKNIYVLNKISNAYSIADLIKTATVNSFHSTKEVEQRFENIHEVTVETVADHRYTNGTIQQRTVLVTKTDVSSKDTFNWESATTSIRNNYTFWLNEVSSYRLRSDLCSKTSKEIECSKQQSP